MPNNESCISVPAWMETGIFTRRQNRCLDGKQDWNSKAGVQKGHDQHPSERWRVSRGSLHQHSHTHPPSQVCYFFWHKNWCHHPITELVQASHRNVDDHDWSSWGAFIFTLHGIYLLHESKPSDSGAKIIISSSCSSCALREPQQNTSTMRTSRTKVRKNATVMSPELLDRIG